jgi:branched-chain amino acid transport system permease protein
MLVLLLAFPFIMNENPYLIDLMIIFFIYAVVASNWDITMGYTGILNFGHLGFLAIGAYVSGMMIKFLGLSPWLGLPIGGAAGLLLGLILSIPSVRLRDVYVVLLTFASLMIFQKMITWPYLAPWTGGVAGLVNIPTFSIGDFSFRNLEMPYYYLALAIFLASTYFLHRITKSHFGIAWRAIRDSEDHAKTLGINAYRYKIASFAASSFFTGVMGSFYASYVGSIDISIIGWDLLISTEVAMILGGLGTVFGPILGAFAMTLIVEYMRGYGAYRLIFLGVLTIVLVIYVRSGLWGTLTTQLRKLGKKQPQPDQKENVFQTENL